MKIILHCLLVFLLVSCSAGSGKSVLNTPPQIKSPKLLVFISVDQMRYDYLERFEPYFEKGLKRLFSEGTVYTDVHHMHAPTNTAPGHASLSTGRYPAHHGVISNAFYDKEKKKNIYCVEDLDVNILGVEHDGSLPGRSPKNLQVDALGDWLKKSNSKSKVYSVSKKDRAAILMGGKSPNQAFWLDELTGKFVSSDYYKEKYPDWANQFMAFEEMKDFLENGWHKKAEEEVYKASREDEFFPETGAFWSMFPHTIQRMSPQIPEGRRNSVMITSTPMADELVLKFSRLVMEKTKLGKDDDTDILFIGCSAADAIGHHFGPYSQEVQDYYLYLDEYLGDFFDFLDNKVGKDNYWAVLSADHGVAAFPEELKNKGIDARRIIYTKLYRDLDSINNAVKTQLSLTDTLLIKGTGGIFLKYDEALSKGISAKVLRRHYAKAVEKLDYIEAAYTSDELKSDVDKPYIELYRNSYFADRSQDVFVRTKENYLIHAPTGTSHGSPYDYDSHVPLIFLGHPFQARKIDRKAATVDISVTLAALLNIKTPDEVDGKVLAELIK